MKHPGHSTAKNQYQGRTSSKLNLTQKQQLNVDMKEFADRTRKLIEDKENQNNKD